MCYKSHVIITSIWPVEIWQQQDRQSRRRITACTCRSSRPWCACSEMPSSSALAVCYLDRKTESHILVSHSRSDNSKILGHENNFLGNNRRPKLKDDKMIVSWQTRAANYHLKATILSTINICRYSFLFVFLATTNKVTKCIFWTFLKQSLRLKE